MFLNRYILYMCVCVCVCVCVLEHKSNKSRKLQFKIGKIGPSSLVN
jgi:hypothetical protein